MTDMIEAIARRWFEREPSTQLPKWEAQPEGIKRHYRALAHQFWDRPGKLTDILKSISIRTISMTTDIDRGVKAWVKEDAA